MQSSTQRCRVSSSLLLITGLFIAGSTELNAQQISESTTLTPQTYPNPFRQGLTLADNASNVPSTPAVDVIRLSSLPSHDERPVVTAISVSPIGDILAAAGDDHAIRIVDLKSGKTTATLTGHLDWVQCVEFSPNGQQLASCGADGTLRVWSLVSTPKLISKKSVAHSLLTLTFINDECIYAAGFSNRIYRYDGDQRELSIVHTCDCRDIRTIVASPDRKWIAFGGRDGVLRMRRVDLAEQAQIAVQDSTRQLDPTNENELAVPLHFDRIRTLQFSADGSQITSVGEDRRIIHYDPVKRVVVGKAEIGGGKLLGLCQLEPHLFAIASSDNTIRIYNDADQQVHARLVGHDGSVSILKRTQKYLISGSFDTTIRIWDIDRAIASIDSQGRYVHPVAAQFEDSGAGVDIK